MRKLLFILFLPVVSAMSLANATSSHNCPPKSGVALQVLGSGGPIADDARASSGYLVWVDGASRIMIDAGGGTFLRFGEAGASFENLDFIGLSHFHADHSASLPALLKSGYFSDRQRSLIVTGPDSGGPFPGLVAYLDSMLDEDDGAYRYLSGYLIGSGNLPNIAAFEISKDNIGAVTVLGDSYGRMQIDTLHVPHGIVPALAFRVRIGQSSIVFAGDQNGNDVKFVEFAKGATMLVMHMPVPEGVAGAGRKLHAPPGVIGAIANEAQVETLILSHLMARSLKNLSKNVEIVKSHYDGRVIVANDLDCVLIDQ